MRNAEYDLDRLPEWDFALTVRGVRVPTLAPTRVPEATLHRTPTAAERRAARRPGAIVRLWRWLAGQPAPIDETRADAETEHTRALVRLFTPDIYHRPVIDQLNGGELMAALAAYMGAQAAWVAEIRRAAEEQSSRAAEQQSSRGAERQNGGAGPGVSRMPMTRLRTGCPPPDWMREVFGPGEHEANGQMAKGQMANGEVTE